MTATEVMQELEKKGTAQTKKTFLRHGAIEPIFGVSIADLKVIQKKVKKDHQLSLDLFATGNADAQYLAGLIADDKKISKKELEKWVKTACWNMISEFTVPWIAAESRHGWELGLEWIASKKDPVASAGWSTLSNSVALLPDDQLDLKQIEKLLAGIAKNIHAAGNRTRYCMNSFVIAVGCYVAPLSDKAKLIAEKFGIVNVNVGDTACKVPDAISYIDKVVSMGRLGRKKKQARC